jgi:hypothetical protein
MDSPIPQQKCEYLRQIAKQRFDRCRSSWIECGRWATPHRIKWMNSQTEGERTNMHIVDGTHLLALRSYVAGFLEGNTSASRPWYRFATADPELNMRANCHEWLDRFTQRTFSILSESNFYNAAGQFYYDFGVFNTGAHYIEEVDRRLYFHTLVPGSYYVLNNGYNEAVTMVREFSMTVKAVVETYGKRTASGGWDWSNISRQTRKLYEDGIYTMPITVVHVCTENPDFNPSGPQALLNRKWVSITYELGATGSSGTEYAALELTEGLDEREKGNKFLNVSASRRKPFIVGKSDSGNNFEYGETGPTLMALGIIKSLNKKAISKDMALEQMLKPPLQGPANLKKSYITTAANSYIPLDPHTISKNGLRPVFEVNPAIAALVQDVTDLRQMVDKLYYADFLLYLSMNPKTRTATETENIVREQQLVIGPMLQSLNWTYNIPVVEFVADYVMFDDPVMENWPMPRELAGQYLRPVFISVFAQAQKAADLPVIDRYMAMVGNVGQINPAVWDKVNLDKLCDLYEDRLFLPAGLNRPQDKVDAIREAQQRQQQQQRMLEETLPAVAGAAKDVGLQMNNQNGGQPQ